MAKIEVLKARDLTPLFVSITGNLPHTGARFFKNKRYRTMLTESTRGSKKLDGQFWNFVQMASPASERELAMQYPDEIGQVSPSVIASIMSVHDGKLAFGLGDLHPKAPFLFFKDKDSKVITQMLKWMRENLSDPALAIRHDYCLRVSFTDENDFVLARLKFQ